MVQLYAVFYRKTQYNPNHSYYQNADRHNGVRCFISLAEAQAFADTVNTKYICDYTGRKIMEA